MDEQQLAEWEQRAQGVAQARDTAFDAVGCSTGKYALDEFYFTDEQGGCAAWAPETILLLVAEVRRLRAEVERLTDYYEWKLKGH